MNSPTYLFYRRGEISEPQHGMRTKFVTITNAKFRQQQHWLRNGNMVLKKVWKMVSAILC